MYIIDGQEYETQEDAPDLGSLIGTQNEDGTRSYKGKWEDKDKLPKYPSLKTGSSAFLFDGEKYILLVYHKTSKIWEGGWISFTPDELPKSGKKINFAKVVFE